jgi:two-component system, cell cycle sensor histidine kinase and response regulator CckA
MPHRAHSPSKMDRLRRQMGFCLVLLLGVAASLALYRFATYTEERRIEEEFYRRAAVRHALISESIHGYEECLYSLRNLFMSSDDVTADEFASTARDILSRHQGIQALQWVPVVPADRRTGVEAWARKAINQDYTITERTSDNALVTAGERPVYYPILYTYPVAGNEPALGYDLKVGPSQNDLARSLKTRSLVLTRKFRLVQEEPGVNRYGVVMACPVFATTPSGAEQHLGFVQIVFKIDDMLDQSWIVYPVNALDAVILDVTQPMDSDPFIYGRRASGSHLPPPASLADINMSFGQTVTLEIGGRAWKCHYAPGEGWKSADTGGLPRLVLSGSLIFTLVLGSYFLSVRRRAELVAQQVDERTAELRHTQGLLEADIAKRQATEAELRESRRQLDSIFGQMPGMAYRYINQTPRIANLISRGSIEIIGYTPAELTSGRVCYEELIHPEDLPGHNRIVADAIANRSAYESEYRLRDRNQHIKWVLDRGQGIYSTEGNLLFIEGLVIDITRRKQAEADKAALDRKLLESQKLESLGVLAGGIAHDFNNLLTTITGHASITRMDLPAHSPLQEHLMQIEAGAKRAAELCQQMLAYAGKGRFLIQRSSLEKLVRDTIPLLSHSISKRASLRFDFSPDTPDIDADATQLRQIIMNLVVNASDAIGDRDGTIMLTTGKLGHDDPRLTHAVLPPPSCAEDFAFLSVIDTGGGMPRETIDKIFDPFFTTKFAGRGLGLAAVLGIVRSHHGSLLVESTPGLGSSFTLVLPPSKSVPPATATGSRPPLESRAHPLAGTVLLIDDEEGVRGVADQMFQSLGLKTLTAADGVEGLELFGKHQADIALVLLDLTMPRMSGEETLRQLRALAPQLPVILMSGYNESAVSGFADDPKLSFLQKPFSLQVLHRQISRILG